LLLFTVIFENEQLLNYCGVIYSMKKSNLGLSRPRMWKRKQWKWLNYCGSGSTLKKEAGSGSKLGSI